MFNTLLSKIILLRDRLKSNWFLSEAYILFKLIWPNLVTTQCLSFIFTTGPILFSGKLEDPTTSVAAVSLSVTFSFLFGFIPIYGISSALDTLATQAYGAKEYKLLGVYLQRGIAILGVMCLPLSVLYIEFDSLLMLIGEDEAIVNLCRDFMQINVFSLPILTMTIFIKVFEAQNIVIPPAIILLAGTILNICITTVIIYAISKSVASIAVAGLITYSIMFAVFLAYLYFSRVLNKIWGGLTVNAFKRWPEFLGLGVPICLALVADTIAVELGIFIIGATTNEDDASGQITVYAILVCISDVLEFCSYAIYVGITIRVGNLVGENNITQAKRAGFTGVIIGLIVNFLVVTPIFLCRYSIAYVFISDIEVASSVGYLIVFLIPSSLLTALALALNGILSGLGKQLVGVVQVLVGMAVGIPLSVVLTVYYKMGATGFWVGVIVGYLSKGVVSLAINVYYYTCGRVLRTSNETVSNAVSVVPLTEGASLVSGVDENKFIKEHTKDTNSNAECGNPQRRRRYAVLMRKALPFMVPLVMLITLILVFVSVVNCKYNTNRKAIAIDSSLQYDVNIVCLQLLSDYNASINSSSILNS